MFRPYYYNSELFENHSLQVFIEQEKYGCVLSLTFSLHGACLLRYTLVDIDIIIDPSDLRKLTLTFTNLIFHLNNQYTLILGKIPR